MQTVLLQKNNIDLTNTPDNRRKKFVESLQVAKEEKNWQLYRHYVEQIERIDKQQASKGIKEGEEK